MKSKLNTKSRRQRVASIKLPSIDHHAILARRLDRLADHNLHLGFHLAAERLAHQAAQLREASR